MLDSLDCDVIDLLLSCLAIENGGDEKSLRKYVLLKLKQLNTTMDIKLFLIFVVILSAMQQGPAVYRDLTCMELEPGYAKRMLYYFTATEMEKVCPTRADLIWGIGKEVFCTILCVIQSLMLTVGYVYVQWTGNRARERLSTMASTLQEWRIRRSLCRFCGTAPCQAKRTSWMRFRPRIKNVVDFEGRSNAMWMFSLGLELSVDVTKELPRDDLYWARKWCEDFQEEHLVLFPFCIRRQINDWYPVPY